MGVNVQKRRNMDDILKESIVVVTTRRRLEWSWYAKRRADREDIRAAMDEKLDGK